MLKNKKGQLITAGILTAIGGVLLSIWSGISQVATGIFNILSMIFTYIFALFQAIYQNSPKVFKIIIWLFLILVVSNAIVGTILHLNFYCDSNDNLLRPAGFFDGIKLFFTTSLTDIENNTLTYNEYLANNTIIAKTYNQNDPESIIDIKCLSNTPRIALFGKLDILDYRMWVIVLIIGALFSFYFNIIGK